MQFVETQAALTTHTILATRPISVVYMQLSSITTEVYGMQLFVAILASYMQSSGINYTFVGDTQPLITLTYTIYYLLFANNLLATMITTNIGHSKDLSYIAKIYINMTKYSNYNDSFILKLVIFDNICSKVDFLSKANMKLFLIMLKTLALDYYYSYISNSDITINFYQVYYLILTYFEEIKYKHYLARFKVR